MVNLVKAILTTKKSDQKQMKKLKKQLRNNESDINKERATNNISEIMAPIHAAIITENTEIVQQIVKTKGFDVDAVWKVNGISYDVLKKALIQTHPSIEIIKILLEFVRNPVMNAELGVPECILTAIEAEYVEILELFREKALFKAIDDAKILELVTVAYYANKPSVFRWLLQLPEVASYKDEGEMKRLLTNLLDEAREDGRVEMCELLTEFMGKSLGGLEGDEVGMPLKDTQDNSEEIESNDNVVAVNIKYCWNCENPSKYMCAGCRKARYCGSNCQWDHWDSHKGYCLVKMNKIAFNEFKSISPSIFQ